MTAAARALRNLRMLHGVFLLTIVLYAAALTQIPAVSHDPQRILLYVFALVAVSDVLLAFVLRAQLVAAPAHVLLTNPEDANALRKWRSGNLISFVLAETLALLGVLLKFLGFGWNVAAVYFAAAIVLLMLFTPKLELPGES